MEFALVILAIIIGVTAGCLTKVEKKKAQPTKSRRVTKVFVGSWGVFTVWLVLFFPVAIIYYFTNIEKEE